MKVISHRQRIHSLFARRVIYSCFLLGVLFAPVVRGQPIKVTPTYNFDRAVLPAGGHLWQGLPRPATKIHTTFIHQSLPEQVNTSQGDLDVDGHLQSAIIQLEYALNEEWSLLVHQLGYHRLRPDNTTVIPREDGGRDLYVGAKWQFFEDKQTGVSWAIRLLGKLPVGSESVFQGEGNGTISPSFVTLKLLKSAQISFTSGIEWSLDDRQSDRLVNALSIGYHATKTFTPFLNFTHQYILNAGDGSLRFDRGNNPQALPEIARFEAGEFANLGAEQSEANRNQYTIGLGLRWQATESTTLGAAASFPLHDEENGLVSAKWTADAIYRF